VTGFALLVVNTWQLSQIQADSSIGWIIFLLVLRGLALGLTVQTTMVTALSVVPRRELARGSSLTNATRLVVQSIGVAVLATVLASTLSPEVKAMQNQFQGKAAASSQAFGLCETGPAVGQGMVQNGGGVPRLGSLTLPAGSEQGPAASVPDGGTVQQACRENIAGFEQAYQVTFYAALAALVLGLMLPGWPAKWSGRQDAPQPPTGMH
jgi:hypothetical protein